MDLAFSIPDDAVDAIADKIRDRIASLFADDHFDVDALIPIPGETHAQFCARSRSDAVVPDTHKWDPWYAADGGGIGAWIPGEAPFTLPPAV
jgi:hypothetical protein